MKLKLTHIGLSLLAGTAALVCAVSPAQAADIPHSRLRPT
jgi:hypothetical protein